MKSRLFLILLFGCLAAAAQDPQPKDPATLRHEARIAFGKSLIELRNAESSGNAKKTAAARASMRMAQQQYKSATFIDLQARMRQQSDPERYVYKERSRLAEERYKHNQALLKFAENSTDHQTEAQRRASLASNEAMLRMKLIEDEVNEVQVRRYRPVEDRNYKRSATLHDQRVDSKIARMEELMESIEGADFNESYHKGRKAEVDKMMKRARYELQMQEYAALAETHNYRDPETKQPLPDLLQRKASANAMRALEERVRARAHDGGAPEAFVNLFSGDKKDSRLTTARQLYSARMNDIGTQSLSLLDGKDATPEEHALAMSNAIHKKKARLEEWFAKEYLPDANDGKDSVVSQWWNLGMGTADRALRPDSEEGINTVRRKIDAALADADRAATALQVVATKGAGKLSREQRELLINYGMLEKGKNGKLHLVKPSTTRKLNQVADINKPKSPWLDIVSLDSTAKTGLSIATGSGTAVAVQRIAQGANLSSRATAALGVMAEVGTSSALDSLWNVSKGKEADFDQALLQNLTMSVIGSATGKVGQEFLQNNKSWAEALEESGKHSMFRELIGTAGSGESILRSDQVKRFIAQTAGAASDAGIETLYQAAAAGGPIDRDAFMANMLQGAMSKAAGNAMKHGGARAKERFMEKLPPKLKEWVNTHPTAWDDAAELAKKSESHAQKAMNRFEEVKKRADSGGLFSLKKRRRSDGELFNDPDFANHVVESLKKGEMRWSDLGIIAEKEGVSVSKLMHEIKDKRTRWAYGVPEPDAEITKQRAVRNLNEKLQANIAKISEGGGSASQKQAKIDALKAGYKETVSLLGQKVDSEQGRTAAKAFKDAKTDLFTESVMSDGIGPEVKANALRDLDREYTDKMDAVRRKHFFGKGEEAISRSEMNTQLAALKSEKSKIKDSIDNVKMIAPGSGNPTSDIDRSWSEPRVVQAMKRLQRDKLLLEREGVKGVGPTTARAWDLNEYQNVMDGVSDAIPHRNDEKNGFHNLKVEVEGVGPVTHDDAVAGNIRASAMSHMSPEHRELYKKNALKEAHGNPQRYEEVKREFAIADRELAGSEKRLAKAREKVAERYGLDPNSAEADIYARDLVYGETMRDVKKLDDEIAGLSVGSDAWKQKQSKRERLMNQASRDGIEAYTDAAGLDIIVNRMQSKTNKKGETMSVNDLWNDKKFNIKGELSTISERQMDNMMSDQVMMISEHLNAYMNGEETTYQTARALAKYGQRAALVAKMKGMDLPEGHPLRELFDKTSELMKYKGDPEKLVEALDKMAGDGGTARDGLKKLVEMTEGAVPGLKDYTTIKPRDPHAQRTGKDGKPLPRLPQGFSSYSSYKDWLRERDRRFHEGGQPAVDRWLGQQQDGIKHEQQLLKEENEELTRLGKDFLPKDFKRVRDLKEDYDAYKKLLKSIPLSLRQSPVYLSMLKKMEAAERELEELRNKKDAWVKEHGKDPENPDLAANEREQAMLDKKEMMIKDAIENGCAPPQIKAAATVADGDIDALFKEDAPAETEKGRRNGIVPALNDAAKRFSE